MSVLVISDKNVSREVKRRIIHYMYILFGRTDWDRVRLRSRVTIGRNTLKLVDNFVCLGFLLTAVGGIGSEPKIQKMMKAERIYKEGKPFKDGVHFCFDGNRKVWSTAYKNRSCGIWRQYGAVKEKCNCESMGLLTR